MFKLAPVFTDNMVLQRASEVTIWGYTDEDIEITGEICGKKAAAEIKDKKFTLKFNDLKAGGPFELKVSGGKESITLKNVLVGEVWIAGGQSNMEFQLKNTIDAEEEISKAFYPEIRYYYTPQIEYESEKEVIPNMVDKGWQVSSCETAGEFSAVAYHFAKNLHKALKVPVGIISCNKGGTSASCWISEKYLEEDEEIKSSYAYTYKKDIEDLTEEEEDKKRKEYADTLGDYNKREQEYKNKFPESSFEELSEAVGPFPWPPPIGRKAYRRPSGLYYTMLQKIVPYTAKGVIWYQGEEDSYKANLYYKLFTRVIKNWREDFKNEELPFIFVQLPMFNEEAKDTWQIIRDTQLKVFKNTKNTGMVVTTDCGEKNNVHPKNKKPVGERLALLIREEIYKEKINGHSPIYKDYEILGDKIEISFDYVTSGDLCSDGDEIKGFEIKGEDNKFYKAKAEIKDDKIIAWSDEVRSPKALRYGWENYIELNLFNKKGLPVSPFNTDSNY